MCVRAYNGDISTKALLGGNWELHGDYWRSLIRAAALEGEIYVVRNPKGQIVSIAVWFPPGNDLFNSEEQRALGFNDFFAKLSPETQEWWNTTCDEVMGELAKKVFTKEERESRWWCVNLATEPTYQGRGYATALIDTMFQKAKSTGTILGLATAPDYNVPKYLGMGFRERGNAPMPSPTGDFVVHMFSKP
ncbi:hypothetical protein K435DRAFT_781417 [Dendrothele bispora CBS 962.96]|uniref:N-acetyltransferase domain-containing protein n=1 Tax=Dendrothele bispora (strain CBS 962.96) TaxID=1314807 RepID=A0A4S8LL01_DENBC|nr:hypothetical protein K435DRAFT_781417 [Dendrothele bispora CBS 962.96]